MIAYLTMLFTVLPVILIATFFWSRDVDKEPKKVIVKIIIFEVIFCLFLCLPVELLSDKFSKMGILECLFYYLFCVGICEEFTKFLSAYIFGMRSKYYNSYYDAVLYCVFASLAFSGFENIFYVADGGLITAIMRCFLSIPGHIVYGAIIGIFFGFATMQKREGKKGLAVFYFLVGLVSSGFLHGFFDFVITDEKLLLLFITLIIEFILGIFIILFVNKVGKIDSFDIDKKICNSFMFKVLILVLLEVILVFSLSVIPGANVKSLEEYDDDELSIQIISHDIVDLKEQILSSYNGKYFRVKVSIENKTDNDMSFFSSRSFKIYNKYANINLSQSTRFINDNVYSIEANKTRTGYLYFELDDDSDVDENSVLSLVFTDCSKDMIKCDTSYITIK